MNAGFILIFPEQNKTDCYRKKHTTEMFCLLTVKDCSLVRQYGMPESYACAALAGVFHEV